MDSQAERLKQIRLEKGLSLEEVQKKTRIHMNILKAIEGDSMSNLSPIYLKSFIKIYCGYLGIDYRDYITEDKECKAKAKETQSAGYDAVASADQKKESSFLDSKPVKLHALDLWKYLKIILFVLIGAAVLWLAFFSLGKFLASRKASPTAAKVPVKTAAIKKETKKTAAKQPAVKAVASAPKIQEIPLKPSKDSVSLIRLTVRTREDCFVHVKSDGKVVFHQTLVKGRPESFDAKERIELSIGNAAAVDLDVNGKSFAKLGRRGEPIKNITITKEGITIPR